MSNTKDDGNKPADKSFAELLQDMKDAAPGRGDAANPCGHILSINAHCDNPNDPAARDKTARALVMLLAMWQRLGLPQEATLLGDMGGVMISATVEPVPCEHNHGPVDKKDLN
jgi:hypothetical protein